MSNGNEYKIKVPRCCHQTVPGQEPPSASLSLPRRDSRRLRGPQRRPQQEIYFTERRSGGEGGGGVTAVFTTAAQSGLSGAGAGCNDLWHTTLCGDAMKAMRPVSIVSTVYWTYFPTNNSWSSF